ncbi:(2Fe-2S)-binding protein [Streptomyces sp. NPDC047002]|uniref:(2Fe-2S)-binding protein n=1 Tax=Streptomyces sp. NPDC047002 TaxID=3155475 RepID=UPI0034527AB9
MKDTDPGAAALDALAAAGPFFAVAAHGSCGPPPGSPWRPLSEAVGDPAVLRRRVDGVRAYLAGAAGRPAGGVELRVAASAAHLGLVARVLSPFFALAALGGAPRVPALSELYWVPEPGGAFPLSLPRTCLAGPDGSVPESAGPVLDGLVAPLTEAVAGLSVPRTTLRGNAASAVNGARAALTAALPHTADPAARTARAFLGHPALRGTFDDCGGAAPFRRRSCCLIYRALPGTGRAAAVCGDCVLAGR